MLLYAQRNSHNNLCVIILGREKNKYAIHYFSILLFLFIVILLLLLSLFCSFEKLINHSLIFLFLSLALVAYCRRYYYYYFFLLLSKHTFYYNTNIQSVYRCFFVFFFFFIFFLYFIYWNLYIFFCVDCVHSDIII